MELTLREAATLTGKSERTLRAQVARGELTLTAPSIAPGEAAPPLRVVLE